MAEYNISQIAEIIGARQLIDDPDQQVRRLLYDSRQLFNPDGRLFFALKGKNHDGHRYLDELIAKGVRNFCVSTLPEEKIAGCNYLLVDNTLRALQQLAAYIRSASNARIIAITGSNGKTTVKSWLTGIMRQQYHLCSTPKSYNSQIGVPLSVWELEPVDQFGVFEAGIGEAGEMTALQAILRPEIGIFTNIGSAHDQNFDNREQKIAEKLKLFSEAKQLVCQQEDSLLYRMITAQAERKKTSLLTWSFAEPTADLYVPNQKVEDGQTLLEADFRGEAVSLKIPFTDDASKQNIMHCWRLTLELGMDNDLIQEAVSRLTPVAMRLEMKKGLNHSILVNDTYNSDLESLVIALNFQKNHTGRAERMLIISEMLQTGLSAERLNREMGRIINGFQLDQVIGIGPNLRADQLNLQTAHQLYPTTDAFLRDIFKYQFGGKSILIKGARRFELEKVSQRLEAKTHETLLKIYLNRMVENLNYFRDKLKPGTRVMAMVKAFSYGSGTVEIAKLLEYHKVDYLGVAYTDEGITLREAGVKLPILVLNPEVETYGELIAFDLEPEIFNLNRLKLFTRAVQESDIGRAYPVHLKLETGMNRLGFTAGDLPALVRELHRNKFLEVRSVFSHLAAADDPAERDFTLSQIASFEAMCQQISQSIEGNFLAHLCNSGGISNYPQAHYDMVRLGIGLYGIGFNLADRRFLQPVSELQASVSQIKKIKEGDTVSYGRSFVAEKPMEIAVISIGYADGFRRSLSNGRGEVAIRGKRYPVVGRVCMDMIMADVTGAEVQEGDPVEIFGEHISIYELAEKMNTIPYEVLTGIGQRVKRVYIME